MTAELTALREAVSNACKFLGPGSRTGRNLEQAMLAAERASQAAAQPRSSFDKGHWHYRTAPKASTHVGRYFIESDDSTHDVRLYINGDFGNDEDRRCYGEALAAALNGALSTTG